MVTDTREVLKSWDQAQDEALQCSRAKFAGHASGGGCHGVDGGLDVALREIVDARDLSKR